jgi:hypothetical protein
MAEQQLFYFILIRQYAHIIWINDNLCDDIHILFLNFNWLLIEGFDPTGPSEYLIFFLKGLLAENT